jgi:hypothetical protein
LARKDAKPNDAAPSSTRAAFFLFDRVQEAEPSGREDGARNHATRANSRAGKAESFSPPSRAGSTAVRAGGFGCSFTSVKAAGHDEESRE